MALGLTDSLKFGMVLLSALAVASGCGDEGGSGSGGHAGHGGSGGNGGSGGAGGGAAVPVEIAFEARVGAAAFDCAAKYTDLGTAKSEVEISDFRLYVHNVELIRKDGTKVAVELDQDGLWQLQSLALLDFENKTGACANGTAETNTKIRGKAPAGSYTGISFDVGVPFEQNHGDAATASSPLNLTALFWSWNEGYKFMRIDAKATGAATPFLFHLGSTACMADAMGTVTSCGMPNRPTVVINDYDPLTGTIVIDYAALVSEVDLSMNGGGAPGCMAGVDDPECAPTMGKLGIHLADGSIHPEEQVVFKGK